MSGFTLEHLAATIAARADSSAETSYTKALLDSGAARVAQKFGAEAVELVIAAAIADDRAVVCEAADALYHLLVLLRARGVDYADVLSELERRAGVSGHAEKAARGGGGAQAGGGAKAS